MCLELLENLKIFRLWSVIIMNGLLWLSRTVLKNKHYFQRGRQATEVFYNIEKNK